MGILPTISMKLTYFNKKKSREKNFKHIETNIPDKNTNAKIFNKIFTN